MTNIQIQIDHPKDEVVTSNDILFSNDENEKQDKLKLNLRNTYLLCEKYLDIIIY